MTKAELREAWIRALETRRPTGRARSEGARASVVDRLLPRDVARLRARWSDALPVDPDTWDDPAWGVDVARLTAPERNALREAWRAGGAPPAATVRPHLSGIGVGFETRDGGWITLPRRLLGLVASALDDVDARMFVEAFAEDGCDVWWIGADAADAVAAEFASAVETLDAWRSTDSPMLRAAIVRRAALLAPDDAVQAAAMRIRGRLFAALRKGAQPSPLAWLCDDVRENVELWSRAVPARLAVDDEDLILRALDLDVPDCPAADGARAVAWWLDAADWRLAEAAAALAASGVSPLADPRDVHVDEPSAVAPWWEIDAPPLAAVDVVDAVLAVVPPQESPVAPGELLPDDPSWRTVCAAARSDAFVAEIRDAVASESSWLGFDAPGEGSGPPLWAIIGRLRREEALLDALAGLRADDPDDADAWREELDRIRAIPRHELLDGFPSPVRAGERDRSGGGRVAAGFVHGLSDGISEAYGDVHAPTDPFSTRR